MLFWLDGNSHRLRRRVGPISSFRDRRCRCVFRAARVPLPEWLARAELVLFRVVVLLRFKFTRLNRCLVNFLAHHRLMEERHFNLLLDRRVRKAFQIVSRQPQAAWLRCLLGR